MRRVLSVLAVLMVAGCGGHIESTPYVWPDPVYGVPWEAKSFTLRYSDWWNTPEDIRLKIVELCGPGYDIARVSPMENVGTAVHPSQLTVSCGSPPEIRPLYRGQRIPDSYLLSLKPPAAPKP